MEQLFNKYFDFYSENFNLYDNKNRVRTNTSSENQVSNNKCIKQFNEVSIYASNLHKILFNEDADHFFYYFVFDKEFIDLSARKQTNEITPSTQ